MYECVQYYLHQLDQSGSREDRNRDDLQRERPGSPLIPSPIVDIPTNHPIQAYREHYAHIIQVMETFVNRKAKTIDRIKVTVDTETDEGTSQAPTADAGADPRISSLAPDPDGQATRQSHHTTHTHRISHKAYNYIQFQLTLF